MMFEQMFGSFDSGRVGRGTFIVLKILLRAIAIVVAIALGVGAGILDQLGLSDEPETVAPLGLGALLLFAILGLAQVVGTLNLTAKRARDIGWSPLLAVIAMVVITPLTWLVLAVVSGRDEPSAKPIG